MRNTADETDFAILRIIQINCRLAHDEIGKQVNLSHSAVSSRIQKLQALGYITDYRATINVRKLGFSTLVIALLSLNEHGGGAPKRFEAQLKKSFPNVIECIPLLGDWDYMLKIVARNPTEYEEIVRQLHLLNEVRKVQSCISQAGGFTSALPLPEIRP